MISHELITHAIDLSPLAIPLLLAFSKKVRESIWQRDGGQSVWSGETEGLSAAHQNHNRNDPKYNQPSNGRLLTLPKEQYIDHFNRHGTADLGLTEEQNMWSLRLLYGMLGDAQEELPPPEEAGTKIIPIPRKKNSRQ